MAMGPSRDWCMSYIRTVCGIAKIVQIIFSIIAFLCSVVVNWAYYGGGWVNFVAMTGFIQACIYFGLHFLNFAPSSQLFFIIELISYCVLSVFFLIAGIVAAVCAGRYGNSSIGAAAFFCFASMVAWIVDTVFQFLEMRKGPSSGGNSAPPTAADATPTY